MPVDDALRERLERLVPEVDDPAAVVAAVEQRRTSVGASRRRSRTLVAASIVLLAAAALAAVWMSVDREATDPAGTTGEPVRILVGDPPDGFAVALVDDAPVIPAVDSWGPHHPVGTSPAAAQYTVSYREAEPDELTRRFELEVLVGSQLDVGALEADLVGLDHFEVERVSIGGRIGLVAWDPDPRYSSDRVWIELDEAVARLDIHGFDRPSVMAVAGDVRVVSGDEWARAIVGADVAPPYGFVDATVLIGAGDRWEVVGGTYRKMFSDREACAELQHVTAPENEMFVDPRVCAGWVDASQPVWLEHVRADRATIVWGLAAEDVARVVLTYDGGLELDIELGAEGPIRSERLPDRLWGIAGQVDADERPARLVAFDADGNELQREVSSPSTRQVPPLVVED